MRLWTISVDQSMQCGHKRTSERMTVLYATRRVQCEIMFPFLPASDLSTWPAWLKAYSRCTVCGYLFKTAPWKTCGFWKVWTSFKLVEAFRFYQTLCKIDVLQSQRQCYGLSHICKSCVQTLQCDEVGESFSASETLYDTHITKTSYLCALTNSSGLAGAICLFYYVLRYDLTQKIKSSSFGIYTKISDL